jgi:caspase domain-containing protein
LKRALLVGIDKYVNFGDLGGCENDVDAIESLLGNNDSGSPNFECQTRTTATGAVTRDQLIADLGALLAPGADIAIFYFAGHGAPRQDDVVLVTTDGTSITPGVAFSELLATVANSQVKEVIIMLDCCFSGAAGGIPQLGTSAAALRHGVSILMASRSDQTSAEVGGRGLFSTYLCGALDGGAADVVGKVTVAGLYSYLHESFGAWDQRPVFKANVDRLQVIRECNPAVPMEELRQINTLFPTPDAVFPLDPSYEPTEEPRNEEHEAILKIFQHYRPAKLLDPVDEEHLYYACMNSTGAILTPLGRHYWHMADGHRL